MWWTRRPTPEPEEVIDILGPVLMRMDAKLDEIFDALLDEDDEAEPDA
jgi:hypothetical protein